ncbi:MAG: TIR domain-containing protein [Hyphomonadaceae bacterium]|nr:TIR domain-containing protein [Hyphomonadaceae bacterium]
MDVFISYSRNDGEIAQEMKKDLERRGLKVFFDVERIEAGDIFPDVLDKAIRDSKIVLALWSAASLKKEWCVRECHMAQNHQKLIPIAIESIDPKDLPLSFVNVNFLTLEEGLTLSMSKMWAKLIMRLADRLSMPSLISKEDEPASTLSAAPFSITELLDLMSKDDLKDLCRTCEISGFSTLNKPELVKAILSANMKRTWMLQNLTGSQLQDLMRNMGVFRRVAGINKAEMVLQIAEELIP